MYMITNAFSLKPVTVFFFLEFLTAVMYIHFYFTFKLYKYLTLRRLMSYIYGAPILDVSRSHTTTQHSR